MAAKRLFATVSIGLVAALAVVGSAEALTAHRNPTDASQAIGQAPIDAALVTPHFGWLLTSDHLYVTHDGGSTFADTHVPLPSGQPRGAAFLDSDHGVAAVAVGGELDIARTDNGGATWTTVKATDPAAPSGLEYMDLKVAIGTPTQVSIMARVATGQGFSLATLFASHNAGKTWAEHSAPAAGDISVQADGRTWLAGGVLHDHLFYSDDAGTHWTPSQVSTLAGRQLAAVALPSQGGLSATVLHNGGTEVELLSTGDNGRTWRPDASIPIAGKTAMGVDVQVARTTHGSLVLDTAGTHAYAASQGTDIHPAGLPEGVWRTAFSADGGSGWALATYGHCASGKQDCTLNYALVGTTDGGATWHQLKTWATPIG